MHQMLTRGEPAPWFLAEALNGHKRYSFNTVGGRWVVMLLMGSARHEAPEMALQLVRQNRDLFDDHRACFFGVTVDPNDEGQGRIAQELPGIRWFLDYDRQVSMRYGAIVTSGSTSTYRPHWLLLDPMLRVHSVAAIDEGAAIMAELRNRSLQTNDTSIAPVLVVPDVFSADLCRRLINTYERQGGADSGFMADENGITVLKSDHYQKRRTDTLLTEESISNEVKGRLSSVLRPMIHRAFQFNANRIERLLVACYDGKDGGHFRAHRDNTTKGTAHRKFACTINLNADDYDGGNLQFPEFGRKTYRAPTGGAVVFSCSLLHEAQPVTRGRRYAFLPFFYDDDGARIRERNLAYVGPDLQTYQSGLVPDAPDKVATP